MCGIIGYTGASRARTIIIDGLKRLEYRGYDSAGVAFSGEKLEVVKRGGRVSELESVLPDSPSTAGIGHTRWATHGRADGVNAHPHLSPDGKTAIVHNGIIENLAELKAELPPDEKYASDTDSELIAHFIQRFLSSGADFADAVRLTAEKIEGSATFLAVHEGDGRIYCHKRGAALFVGEGERGSFAASDLQGISAYCDTAFVLEDGDLCVLLDEKHGGGYEITSNGKRVERRSVRTLCAASSECNCHMRREISEIPKAVIAVCRSFRKTFPDECLENIRKAERIAVFACGTAFHAGMYGKEVFETVLKKPVDVFVASEADGARFLSPSVFGIFVSQSGETADTLLALDRCKSKGVKTLAVTNVPGSSITFKADYTLQLDAGAEIAVAATKSYVSQLLAMYLVANAAAGISVPLLTVRAIAKGAEELIRPSLVTDAKDRNLFFVGRGADKITAREGALKFKEITYKLADAYPAGELKHGTIALVDEKSTVIVLATNSEYKSKIEATVCELKARNAEVLAVSSVGDVGADKTVNLPDLPDQLLYPLLAVIPLQILALSTSCALGINPDKPRNLAKSVTVI